MAEPVVVVENLSKAFTLHTQHGVRLPVIQGINLIVRAGECVVLHGPSGSGKSTLLRLLYANYLAERGSIRLRHEDDMVDVVTAPPHKILDLRRRSVGYVSQFLRVIPRVAAIDVVREPLIALGVAPEPARARAQAMLDRLNIPARLWDLAPATFSGGEQQRINVASVFVVEYPLLLLDEPTASLDADNRAVVVELIREAKARGAAVIGIFHDQTVRDAVGDRLFSLSADGAAA